MGADNNYLKSVEIAHGKYCLILGSDDIFNKGSISEILSELKNEHDIYLFNRDECDINMNFLRKFKILNKNIDTQVFNFGMPGQIETYFNAANSLGSLFSYLSSIVFNKSKWDSIEVDKSFIGSIYIHTYVLLSILKTNSSLKYINEYLVSTRIGNDSFITEGYQKRILYDFDGYYLIMHKIFDGYIDTDYYTKKILSASHGFHSQLYFMSSLNDDGKIEEALLNIGYSKTYLLLLKFLKYPYLTLKKLKNKIRSI
jgi:abequosyltransferase